MVSFLAQRNLRVEDTIAILVSRCGAKKCPAEGIIQGIGPGFSSINSVSNKEVTMPVPRKKQSVNGFAVYDLYKQ